MTTTPIDLSQSPFDHNVECRYCDEQAAHRADCPWLVALVEEHRDYQRSFALFEKAAATLMVAYKRAHPEVTDDIWPDMTTVNTWAAEQLKPVTRHYRYIDPKTGEEIFPTDRKPPKDK